MKVGMGWLHWQYTSKAFEVIHLTHFALRIVVPPLSIPPENSFACCSKLYNTVVLLGYHEKEVVALYLLTEIRVHSKNEIGTKKSAF